MSPIQQIIITVFSSVLASSGLWACIQARMIKKDVQTELLIGLAHDRIMYLGGKYLKAGWISPSDYDDLYKYLYLPYKKNGGNGSAERLMEQIKELPPYPPIKIQKGEEKNDTED